MKPISLRMEAFGPYGTVAEVDFGPLADVGLFVVSGPTGAGKSTIFDAICFGLYGSLSGARQGHVDVRSHYADPAADCVVEFVFDVQGQRWKVVRQPAQTRQKRRGRGMTERPAEATLERWQNGQWEPVSAKVREVSERCRELVGLSLEQFERVVLLPQGKFAEVLNARTSERSELLRTLFGSEVFDRAAEVLAEQARDGERALAGADERRAAFHQRAADALDRVDLELAALPEGTAVDQSSTAPTIDASFATSQLSLLDHGSELQQVTNGESIPDELTLADRMGLLTSGPVASVDASVQGLRHHAERMRTDLQRAEGQKRAIDQRTSARRRMAELEHERSAMQILAGEITVGRSLVGLPVVVGRRSDLRGELQRLTSSLGDTWQRVDGLVAMALDDGEAVDPGPDVVAAVPSAEAVTELLDRVAARSVVIDAVVEAVAHTNQKRADHNALSLEIEHLDRAAEETTAAHSVLISERASLEVEQTALEEIARSRERLELEVATAADRVGIRRQFDVVSSRVVALQQRRSEVEGGAVVARKAIAEAAAEIALLDDQIRHRVDLQALVIEAKRRVDRRVEIISAVAELDHASLLSKTAQSRADEVFSEFLHDTAPRLAADLEDDSPCPVCGSCEHPAPAHAREAAADRPVVDLAAVEQAAATAEAARSELSSCQARVARLVGDAAELADAELAELESARTDALGRLRVVEEAVATRDSLAESADLLDERLASAIESAASIDIALSEAAREVSGLSGQLGAAAATPIEQIEIEQRELVAQLGAAVRAEQRLGLVTNRQAEIDRSVADLGRVASARSVQRATAIERLDQLAASILRAEEHRTVTLAGIDLERVVEALDRLRSTLLQWQDAAIELVACRASLDAANDAIAELVRAAGFGDERDAIAAGLSADDLDRAIETHSRWVGDVTTTTAALAVLEGQDLPDDIPDLDELRARALDAEDHHRRLAASAALIEQAIRSASADLDEVAGIDSIHAERRAHLDVVRRVASVVRGNNSKRLSLENWVLSVYLHDVVEHANIHLHTMSNGRYRLLVQDAPSNQIGQHGLDLVVDDAHTGRVRSSVSLSGGETFQASLALALGLADVVMIGRSGLHLDALFVDEGFGSLDADAIDQAITVLDGLRTRGSMVGVITHVEALKNALPVAIEVHPRSDHQGSEIRQVA